MASPQILHTPLGNKALNAEFDEIKHEDSYKNIYDTLQKEWAAEKIAWESINEIIFDVKVEVGRFETPVKVSMLLRNII